MRFRLFVNVLIGLAVIGAGCTGLLSSLSPKVEDVRPRVTGIDFEGATN